MPSFYFIFLFFYFFGKGHNKVTPAFPGANLSANKRFNCNCPYISGIALLKHNPIVLICFQLGSTKRFSERKWTKLLEHKEHFLEYSCSLVGFSVQIMFFILDSCATFPLDFLVHLAIYCYSKVLYFFTI